MPSRPSPVYLDCNATTPIDESVAKLVQRVMSQEYGNAGSRTHEYGSAAKQLVQKARDQIADALGIERDSIVFTSGATESNNLAILGLAAYGARTGRSHMITSAVEHKAVLEPAEELRARGFSLTVLPVTPAGYVEPEALREALTTDTLLVSLMHVNNETGVEQPLADYCEVLRDHDAYFHVDAAQGFGKATAPLRDRRIDLISISGHKIYGPKGIGALITRRRDYKRPPLTPLTYGGGQEWGLRPGTLPVPLIAGLGLAAELAVYQETERARKCQAFRERLMSGLAPLGIQVNGEHERVLPHTLNVAIQGLDAEAFIVATKGLISVSNGSACTSQSYEPSHVLRAMGFDDARIHSSVRLSWCHLTPDVDWCRVVEAVERMRV